MDRSLQNTDRTRLSVFLNEEDSSRVRDLACYLSHREGKIVSVSETIRLIIRDAHFKYEE